MVQRTAAESDVRRLRDGTIETSALHLDILRDMEAHRRPPHRRGGADPRGERGAEGLAADDGFVEPIREVSIPDHRVAAGGPSMRRIMASQTKPAALQA